MLVETGKMLQLEPMPALERRWVHLTLRDHPSVATQSIGEEPNRRVVLVPRDAPDKSSAVHGLVARCGAGCAVFAGDDVNDEPVFESAPAHWLTIRIGRGERHSAARYFLDSPSEMAMLLERMLALLPSLHSE